MDSIFDFMFGDIREEVIGRDVVNGYTIDTCNTTDCGFETAIWYNDYDCDMVIVARYKDKTDAQEGHKKWCNFCTLNPAEVYSVQMDKTCTLRKV